MPHRDPQTGQFMAHDDEPIELTYSDHEFVNFRVEIRDTAGPNSTRGTEYQIESDVLDLENDELAMLSWLNASLVNHVTNFTDGGTTRGSAAVTAEIGANMADSEFLSLADNGGVAVTDEEPDVAEFSLKANDEPGLWAILNTAVNSGYKDSDEAGDPYSGGSSLTQDRIRRVYYDETVGGPYIDATDDVTVAIWVDKTNTEATIRPVVAGQMAFVVMEYENRRAEFAPYDPGAGG